MVQNMDTIEQSSKRIGDIVSVIEPRAGQEVLELMCSTAARDGR